MSARAYSLEAWLRFRGSRERKAEAPPPPVSLADIPADAEMDEGIVLGCWNGERFVSWEKWVASAPIERDPQPEVPVIPSDARCVKATCGATRVWLVRDGERWLMFAGTRSSRRRDFASPFLSHAQRTAESWYGPATKGWQVGAKE
jgi:hypothetical protein